MTRRPFPFPWRLVPLGLLALLILPALTAADSPAPATQPASATQPSPPAFIIGVDSQDVSHFGAWAKRGVNAVVRVPQGNDAAAWAAAADAAGLWQIRPPLPNTDPAADAAAHRLLAFAQPDEPDASLQPADVAGNYAAWSRAGKPVFLSFSGNNVVFQAADFFAPWKAVADWNCFALYPVVGWNQPTWLDHGSADYAAKSLVAGIDKLRTACGDAARPMLAYIECADFSPGGAPPGHRAPTPAETRGECWSAAIHGAGGVIYFPVVLAPWSFDGTTPDMAAEIASIDAALTAWGPALRGADIGFDPSNTAGTTIEACQRQCAGDRYGFALNMSHNPCAWFGQQFAPFAVIIWKNGAVVAQYPAAAAPATNATTAATAATNATAATGAPTTTAAPATQGAAADPLAGAKLILPAGKTYILTPQN